MVTDDDKWKRQIQLNPFLSALHDKLGADDDIYRLARNESWAHSEKMKISSPGWIVLSRWAYWLIRLAHLSRFLNLAVVLRNANRWRKHVFLSSRCSRRLSNFFVWISLSSSKQIDTFLRKNGKALSTEELTRIYRYLSFQTNKEITFEMFR